MFALVPCGFGALVMVQWLFWFIRHELTRRELIESCVFVLGIVTAAMTVACVVIDGIGYGKQARTRPQIYTQLSQIAVAMHNYQDHHERFPPAAVYGPNGGPLYSWRVLLLPFLEQEDLYAEFHLGEPWDSPHNLKLLARMPAVYQAPEFTVAPEAYMTFYQVFVGPRAAFEGTRGLKLPADFPDGSSNTFLVVEAREAVPWTKPVDLPYAADQPLPELGIPRKHRIGRLEYGRYNP